MYLFQDEINICQIYYKYECKMEERQENGNEDHHSHGLYHGQTVIGPRAVVASVGPHLV